MSPHTFIQDHTVIQATRVSSPKKTCTLKFIISMFIWSFRVSKYQFKALCVFFNNAVWLQIDMDNKSASYCDNM